MTEVRIAPARYASGASRERWVVESAETGIRYLSFMQMRRAEGGGAKVAARPTLSHIPLPCHVRLKNIVRVIDNYPELHRVVEAAL